ncbi:unnamed protein product [Plutella xylostella]|uniref:(diamondback moth) hypothetical protein n=1 Tax=Plutella xylostella TaxID=51655 RepID=A0A8S4FCT7_PLUXY|nr:unnamed protein product [Plutella xylostella]
MTDSLVASLDSGEKCIAVFLDLRKAFDTLSIPILLKKLENIGIRGQPLKLLSDYLKNRSQSVKVSDTVSDSLPVNYGAPQGSVLAPTLFLAYINDLCDLELANGQVVSFADDTALLFKGVNWRDAFDYAQRGVDKSILTYCIEVWGGAAQTHLMRLERAQRALLKVAYFLPVLHPTAQLYNKVQVLSGCQDRRRAARVAIDRHCTSPPPRSRRPHSQAGRRTDKTEKIPKN